jgi:hypothetical protein
LQAAAAAADRRRRDSERQQQRAEEERRRQAGEFEELYNTTRQELEAIRNGLARRAVETAVAEAAARLRFHNPTRVAGLIDLSGVNADVQLADGAASVELDNATRTLIEQRVARLAETDPYLVAVAPPRQLPGAGHGNGGPIGDGHARLNAEIRRAAGRA